MANLNSLPIAIIGAGPIGLSAAAHLHKQGQSFIVFEAGAQIADSVKTWEHVPMFTPWKYNLDSTCTEILSGYDWKHPEADEIPTGQELIEEYLFPLSETKEIKPFIRLGAKVTSISKRRVSKMKNAGREKAPFILYIQHENRREVFYARAVIDASGTWKTPTPIGANGLPALGELTNSNRIFYGIPDILGRHRKRYEAKNVTVIGSGHSAINALLELTDLKKTFPDMVLTWVLRKAKVEDTYSGFDQDELPGRGLIGQRVKALIRSGQIEVSTPFYVEALVLDADNKINIIGDNADERQFIITDEIICATGLRPDLEMLRELRISMDVMIECPTKLAPLIDPNIHSCGTVAPHGERELKHPEKDFYIVGMKSYGRAPTFLLATGYEQVRSVVDSLSRDWKAISKVECHAPADGSDAT